MMRLSVLAPIIFAATSSLTSIPTQAAPLHAGCWVVVDPDDPVDIDHAQEVLCVDAAGHGFIRESSDYGEGVKGCNVVTIDAKAGKLVINVDYGRCTNDAPSHTLTRDAPADSGTLACSQLMASEKNGEAGLPVKLAPLPAGQ